MVVAKIILSVAAVIVAILISAVIIWVLNICDRTYPTQKIKDTKLEKLLWEVEKAKDALKYSQYETEEELKNFRTDRIELTFDYQNYLVFENGDAYWEFRGRQFECLKRLLQVKQWESEQFEYEWVTETIPVIGRIGPVYHKVMVRKQEKQSNFGIKSPSE